MDRFHSKYRVNESNGCWEWHASLVHGYGCIGFRGKIWRAHRMSWTLHHGEIPEGLCVCHKCDNPKCVNPEHLFLGTKKDNRDDMVRKGRARFASQSGEANGMARLTDEQVHEIKTSSCGPVELSRKYGVHYRHIWAIRKGIKRAGVAA